MKNLFATWREVLLVVRMLRKMRSTIRQAMDAAESQLFIEGVPIKSLRAAAALIVGQAMMESGLNPKAVHDNGAGYGVFGARDDRLSRMYEWLDSRVYSHDSLQGQIRFMAVEAFHVKAFLPTGRMLHSAHFSSLISNSRIVTANFERPAVTNDRSLATLAAYFCGSRH